MNKAKSMTIIILAVILSTISLFVILKKDKLTGIADSLVGGGVKKNANVRSGKMQMKDFSCEGMSGFAFQYPVFDRYHYADPIMKDGVCTFSILPADFLAVVRMTVEIKKDAEIKLKISGDTPKNPQGIYYQKTDDILTFITSEFLVTIKGVPDMPDHGFYRDKFYNMVIGSFQAQKEITKEQAIEIANNDIKSRYPAYNDLSIYNITSELQTDGWNVHYSLNANTLGGGFMYVIDSNTGKIISRQVFK